MTPPDEYGGKGIGTVPARGAGGGVANDTAVYTSPFYTEMAPRWKLCRDVMLGTEAIRANAVEYLPKSPAETDEELAIRVSRTELFPAFKITVKGLTGMVCRKDPVLQPDVPEEIVQLWENIDGAGTHGAVFFRRVFSDAMVTGHGGILVDMPVVAETGRQLDGTEEKALGIRPYWIHVKAEMIINWHTEIVNGRTILTLLVIKEVVTEPAGSFATISVTRFRVFRRDKLTGVVTFEIWTWGGDEHDPELESEGTLRNAKAIPFAVCYTGERIAALRSLPPLHDLAYTNIAHAQTVSDRRTSLHMSSVPILFFKGFKLPVKDPNNPDAEQEEVIGPNTGIYGPENSDLKYVEHQGHALSETREELRQIEGRMASQGLAMLQADTRAQELATVKRIEKSEQDASLSSASRSGQDMVEECLAHTALFMNLPTGGSCEMSRDFEALAIDTQRIDSISKLQTAGQLSLETMWAILINGGVLPEEMDTNLELARILAQHGVPGTGTPAQPTDDGNPSGGTAVDDTPPGDAVGDVSGDEGTPPAPAPKKRTRKKKAVVA
jgi:Domain of unknown function (DUF4055)